MHPHSGHCGSVVEQLIRNQQVSGSNPLSGSSGKLPRSISQFTLVGCDIFVPDSKEPNRKTLPAASCNTQSRIFYWRMRLFLQSDMYKASEAHEKYGAAEANELRIYYAFLYEKHRKIGYHQVNEGEEGAYHANIW